MGSAAHWVRVAGACLSHHWDLWVSPQTCSSLYGSDSKWETTINSPMATLGLLSQLKPKSLSRSNARAWTFTRWEGVLLGFLSMYFVQKDDRNFAVGITDLSAVPHEQGSLSPYFQKGN